MNALRFALSALSLALLALGYAASQWAYFAGDPRAHAARVDQPEVRLLCLLVLGLAIVFALVPDRTARGDGS